jgi:hypothetical protein
MKSYNEEFQLVLDEMTNEFSTNNFISELKLIGVPIKVIENQYHVGFLNTYCERITKRTYRKKNNIHVKYQSKKQTLVSQENENDKIQKSISLLKSLGYKILKPTTEYQEI